MTYDEILVKIKGGPGSGHWNHRGIVGKRGGSASGGGLAAIGLSKNSSLEERRAASKKMPALKLPADEVKGFQGYRDQIAEWDESQEAQMVRKYAKALESFEDPSGLRIKVNSLYGSHGAYNVSAIIVNQRGDKVGSVDRSFNFQRKEAHHDYFSLNTGVRDTGFGSRFYYASERMYPSMGIEKVTIQANISVGGYAWARMGYDFASEADKTRVIDALERKYWKNYAKESPVMPEKPWEIAAYKGPDGARIGKEVLLTDGEDNGWYAIKRLKASDPGYRAGLEYYKQKGIL